MYLIVSVRMSTCVNVYMNIYTHMRTTVYVSLSYVCVCVCIYVSLYIYIYTSLFIYQPTIPYFFRTEPTPPRESSKKLRFFSTLQPLPQGKTWPKAWRVSRSELEKMDLGSNCCLVLPLPKKVIKKAILWDLHHLLLAGYRFSAAWNKIMLEGFHY